MTNKKQTYLTEDQLENIREVVTDLMNKGLQATLKGDAIENNNQSVYESTGRGRNYMSAEQAWATAVVFRLIAAGYDIKKRE